MSKISVSALHRFGAIGSALADALPFSLDVVGIVASYAACAVATPGDVPKLLFSFGSAGKGDGQVRNTCCSLSIAPDDSIWCGDSRGCQLFSSDGKFVRHVAKGQFHGACAGIAFDSNGDVFCSDCFDHRIVVCRLSGTVVTSFGSQGSGNGQFIWPCGLAVGGQRLLFVADFGNHRVQVLRRDGSFVRSFGGYGSGNGQLQWPIGAALSAAGEIFVGDQFNDRVQAFDVNGKFLREFGSEGSSAGQLKHVEGVALDAVGNVVVCDKDNHRVQIFKSDGTFVTAFGSEGGGLGQFKHPQSVHVDGMGRLFVGDQNCRVQVFGFAAW